MTRVRPSDFAGAVILFVMVISANILVALFQVVP